jgi:hypothetical protein
MVANHGTVLCFLWFMVLPVYSVVEYGEYSPEDEAPYFEAEVTSSCLKPKSALPYPARVLQVGDRVLAQKYVLEQLFARYVHAIIVSKRDSYQYGIKFVPPSLSDSTIKQMITQSIADAKMNFNDDPSIRHFYVLSKSRLVLGKSLRMQLDV